MMKLNDGLGHMERSAHSWDMLPGHPPFPRSICTSITRSLPQIPISKSLRMEISSTLMSPQFWMLPRRYIADFLGRSSLSTARARLDWESLLMRYCSGQARGASGRYWCSHPRRCRGSGFSIVRELGHGVGRRFHVGPQSHILVNGTGVGSAQEWCSRSRQ